jgi:hypothetical protein
VGEAHSPPKGVKNNINNKILITVTGIAGVAYGNSNVMM